MGRVDSVPPDSELPRRKPKGLAVSSPALLAAGPFADAISCRMPYLSAIMSKVFDFCIPTRR